MMKKIIILAFFTVVCSAVFAQKYVPVIKEGSVLTYDAYSKALGQHIKLILTIKSLGDPIKMQWNVAEYGTGGFEMPAKALQSGTKVVIKQPEPDDVTKLKDDETLIVLSKAVFGSMIKDKAFTLNSQKFTVMADTATYKINDKPADVFHAVTDNNKNEIWVVNNPDFPLIYKATNVARGVDFVLEAVKE
jgi:hypothetical protein